MQLDNTRLTNYKDLDTQVKRGSIVFTSAEVITFNGGDTNTIRLGNVAVPQSSTDVANKQYVDTAILGLTFKQPVRAVSQSPGGALDTAFAAGGVVDGVTLAAGDRILLLGQTNGVENGLYVVAATGRPLGPRTSPRATVRAGCTCS